MNLIDFTVTKILERYSKKSRFGDHLMYYVKFEYEDMGGKGESLEGFKDKERADNFDVGFIGQH